MKKAIILGIETSCDETAAAVLAGRREILSNIVSSQISLHKKYGGVVPEIASRRHVETINLVIAEALEEAGIDWSNLSAVAVTQGPGLVGALLIGISAAKCISYFCNIPLLGVNHLEAHIYANFLVHPRLKPPFVALIVSGGHTTLVLMKDYFEIEVIGETLDDACGEAFDKIARFLDLGYPGGPVVDRIAKDGNPSSIYFPRALDKKGNYNFSFSGVKTAVINYVNREKKKGRDIPTADLVASFQEALIDVQVNKLIQLALEKDVDKIVLAGGVAANSALREKLISQAKEAKIKLFYPPPELCTDNAAMIACLGYYRYQAGFFSPLDIDVDSNLKLAISHKL